MKRPDGVPTPSSNVSDESSGEQLFEVEVVAVSTTRYGPLHPSGAFATQAPPAPSHVSAPLVPEEEEVRPDEEVPGNGPT